MISEAINVDIKLKGQYRLTVAGDSGVIVSTPWCNNTILSSGLVDLYSYEVPSILNYLDLGSSDSLPGAAGYGLSGVVSPTSLSNIYRDIVESYQDTLTSKAYIATFTSDKLTSDVSIREFAIKRQEGNCFARNTFPSTYNLSAGQIVTFEYRLTINWPNTITLNMPVTGNNVNYTYTIPVTSTTYNIPYDGVFYKNNVLFLLGNVYNQDGTVNNDLPHMNEAYPILFDWGIGKSEYSTYAPSIKSTSIDNVLRKFTVNTTYSGVVCEANSGVYDNIKTAIIVKDGDLTTSTNSFNATRFAFPLVSYSTYDVCLSSTPSNTSYNKLALDYSYSWSEC